MPGAGGGKDSSSAALRPSTSGRWKPSSFRLCRLSRCAPPSGVCFSAASSAATPTPASCSSTSRRACGTGIGTQPTCWCAVITGGSIGAGLALRSATAIVPRPTTLPISCSVFSSFLSTGTSSPDASLIHVPTHELVSG
ncbi:hypothetical protein FSC37_23190 [Piscinibacter aquaticus]|uniref:Uncharacterized protein n=1 Tax=Piscinibacter aquaticus TaxID=392597 RepID=A0A5C6TNP6_9BURK|nr:hypothetical protein FSC37_23190 [Piscinibacter aquaticus]